MKMPALFDLASHVAIVTGGNGGLGRGIALGLAEAGAAVAVLARNEEKNRGAFGIESHRRSFDGGNDRPHRARRIAPAERVENELGA